MDWETMYGDFCVDSSSMKKLQRIVDHNLMLQSSQDRTLAVISSDEGDEKGEDSCHA